MLDDPVLTQLDQRSETKATLVAKPDGVFCYRYAYARSSDSRNNDDIGQDYLAFCEDGNRLAFVVCDGVSQSFFGDLAASFIGKRLIGWMHNLSSPLDPGGSLNTSLEQFLQESTADASLVISNFRYPEDMPGMVQVVLEKKRKIGSESTFVAGVIDMAKGWYSLAWMGDTRLRLWSTDSEITSRLGDSFHTHERWASRIGLVGNLHVHSGSLNSLIHLAVYTDGLAFLDHAILADGCSNEAMDLIIEEARDQPNSDDTCLFEWWNSQPRFRLAPPKPGGYHRRGLHYEWQPVQNATRYEITLRREDNSKVVAHWVDTPIVTFTEEQVKAASKVCIRAWNDDEPGEENCVPLAQHIKPTAVGTPQVDDLEDAVEMQGELLQLSESKSAIADPPSIIRTVRPPAEPPSAAHQMSGPISVFDQGGTLSDRKDQPRMKASVKGANYSLVIWGILISVIVVICVLIKYYVTNYPGYGGAAEIPPTVQSDQLPLVSVTTGVPDLKLTSPLSSVVPETFTTETATEVSGTLVTILPIATEPPVTPVVNPSSTSKPTEAPTVEPTTTPSTAVQTSAQIINAKNIERLVSFSVKKFYPEQIPTDLLFVPPSEDEPGILWNVLAFSTKVDATAPAEIYHVDASGEWSLEAPLAPLRAAAFTTNRIAGVTAEESGDAAIMLWHKENGTWVQEPEIVVSGAKDICAITFTGNDLVALELTGKLTVFKNGSGSEGNVQTIELKRVGVENPNLPTCLLVPYEDATGHPWLASVLYNWVFDVDLSIANPVPRDKPYNQSVLQILPNGKGGRWVSLQNSLFLVDLGSEQKTPEISIYHQSLAMNITSEHSLLVAVIERKLQKKCGFIDFSGYQPGSPTPRVALLETSFCDARKVYFTPDGKYMVTIAADGQAMVWFSKEK